MGLFDDDINIAQTPFGSEPQGAFNEETNGLEDIHERHVACILLIDTSGSMAAGNAIGQLNEGLRAFKEQISKNKDIKGRIDVAFISFGPNVVLHGKNGTSYRKGESFELKNVFVPAGEMNPPFLTASGGTPMGEALEWSLDIITQQKARYAKVGVPYYRPWIFCMTDGEPNDSYLMSAQKLKQMQDKRGVIGYCVGVENYDKNTMSAIFDKNRILELKGLNFIELFEFLSNSLIATGTSDPNGTGVDVPLPASVQPSFRMG